MAGKVWHGLARIVMGWCVLVRIGMEWYGRSGLARPGWAALAMVRLVRVWQSVVRQVRSGKVRSFWAS